MALAFTVLFIVLIFMALCRPLEFVALVVRVIVIAFLIGVVLLVLA